ncbi:hypothetical protein D9M72_572810 [compost metagenome]
MTPVTWVWVGPLPSNGRRRSISPEAAASTISSRIRATGAGILETSVRTSTGPAVSGSSAAGASSLVAVADLLISGSGIGISSGSFSSSSGSSATGSATGGAAFWSPVAGCSVGTGCGAPCNSLRAKAGENAAGVLKATPAKSSVARRTGRVRFARFRIIGQS